MRKHPDWVQRLDAVVRAAAARPFSWATHNCCSFAAECFESVTGQEDTSEFFPKNGYETKRQAYTAMKKMYDKGGLETVIEVATAKYGLKEVPPLMAQRGDPVLADFEGDHLLATVDLTGRAILVITPDGGLQTLPLTHVVRAWRVS